MNVPALCRMLKPSLIIAVAICCVVVPSVAKTLSDTEFIQLQNEIDSSEAEAIAKMAARWSAIPKETVDDLRSVFSEISAVERQRENSIAEAERLKQAAGEILKNAPQPPVNGTESYGEQLERERKFNEAVRQSNLIRDQYFKLISQSSNLWAQANRIKERKVSDIRNRSRVVEYEAQKSARSDPISLAEAQNALDSNEVLGVIANQGSAVTIHLVSKSQTRSAIAQITSAELKNKVAILRCGLDATVWFEPSDVATDAGRKQVERIQRCRSSLNARAEWHGDRFVLPFNYRTAFELYRILLGPHEDLLANKNLVLVTRGPLSSLPLQVLLTARYEPGQLDRVPWLIRRHAITTMPSVNSIVALRRTVGVGLATRPYLGIGNPALLGPDASFESAAKKAKELSNCSGVVAVGSSASRGRNLARLRSPQHLRSGVDAASLQRLTPLPETAEEVCEVARMLGADTNNESIDILLASGASEANIQRRAKNFDFLRYKVIHFATHGLASGQFARDDEPGLVLTDTEGGEKSARAAYSALKFGIFDNDGYLSATEIAGLQLDADIVILSACNTGSPDLAGAENLSRLTQAFMIARARSVVASHWEVYSDAAVKLITRAMHSLSTQKMRPASALQAAMIELLDSEAEHERHPSYWAPFVVFGG